EEIAKKIAADATSASSLSSIASANKLTAKDQKNYILGSPLGEGPTAGSSEALQDAIYSMKVGDVTKTPLKIGDNWYVVGVTKKEEADMAEFAKQRSSLMESMLSTRRAGVFSDYLAAVKQRMEANGEINVYNSVIEKVDSNGITLGPDGAPA